jgi:hypothetical protein
MTNGLKGEYSQLPGYKFIKEFGPDEQIVSIIEFQGTVFVATSKRVFKLVEELFYPMLFVHGDHGMITDIPPKETGHE